MMFPYCYQPLSRPESDESDAWAALAEHMKEVREENDDGECSTDNNDIPARFGGGNDGNNL